MNDFALISAGVILRLLAGAALGVFFYGALWFTVRALPAARHPVLLTLGSFWIRTLTVVAGILLLMNGRWQYALVCLAGFMLGRLAVSRSLAKQATRPRCA
jgi:F1F0 ATPase subunit 2